MATATAIEISAPASTIRSRRLAGRSWVVAAVACGCVVAFLVLHTWLKIRGYSHNVAQLRSNGVTGPTRSAQWTGQLQGVLADSGGIYFSMLLAAIAIGRRGPRVSMALPLVVWVGGPYLAGLLSGAHGVAPLPVGLEWSWLSATPHALDLWLGSLIDAALVMVPAFAMVGLHSRAPLTAPRWSRPRQSLVGAISLGLFGLWLLVELPRIYGVPGSSAFLTGLVPLAALFVFGAALDGAWRWRWPIVIAVAMLATNNFMQWAVYRFPMPVADLARAVAPFLAAALLGSAIRPANRLFARLEARPIEAVIACNALNIADALLTAVGVRGGLAIETNPIVNLIGLPTKIVVVALLSTALLRTRPRALIWPCVALAAVVLWHVCGFLAQTPFAWWT
jgi:hypothetical protein